MLQILYSSGGLFATKMGLKTPFEIRIVTKFSTFYGMYRHYPHKFTHFFVVPDVFALFDIFQKKAQHNFKKTRGSTAVYKTFKKTDFFQGGVPSPSWELLWQQEERGKTVLWPQENQGKLGHHFLNFEVCRGQDKRICCSAKINIFNVFIRFYISLLLCHHAAKACLNKKGRLPEKNLGFFYKFYKLPPFVCFV